MLVGIVGIFPFVVVVVIMIVVVVVTMIVVVAVIMIVGVSVGVRIRMGMTVRMGGEANWDRDDSLIRHATAFSFRQHRQPLQNTREQRVHSRARDRCCGGRSTEGIRVTGIVVVGVILISTAMIMLGGSLAESAVRIGTVMMVS